MVELASEAIEIPSIQVKEFFGNAFSSVNHFTEMLIEEGELRGLIGPRELPRIWSRHILNCAALAEFLPKKSGSTVADIGSGGGLPGIVLSCMQPNLQFYLIEPMERRVQWLQDIVEELDLDNVEIVRARSQDIPKKVKFDCVTSRAVANLSKLVNISAHLVAGGGKMLALKGEKADQEVLNAKYELKKAGLIDTRVVEITGIMDSSTTRVVIATKKR